MEIDTGLELGGIRPRTYGEAAADGVAERKVADAYARDALNAQAGGVLNTGPFDASVLARELAAVSMELQAMARHVGRLDELVRSLLDTRPPFTEEDIAAIKAHVRHPGALEAAKLRETIRCATVAARAGAWAAVVSILEPEPASEA